MRKFGQILKKDNYETAFRESWWSPYYNYIQYILQGKESCHEIFGPILFLTTLCDKQAKQL